MAIITINGASLPAPSDYSVGIQDLSKAERNANGTMIIERIATKRKIELGWKVLTQAQLSQLLKMVSPVFFTASFVDPQDGGMRTGTFYAGDRNCGMMDFKNGVPLYQDIKFNLIER